MDYPAPDPADLSQVYALNRAFIDFSSTGNARLLAGLPERTRARLAGWDADARERVARCPFLLYSVDEGDTQLWERFFANERQRDLLELRARPDGGESQIACATLALLWQLARRDPYAARVLSGASPAWCERIADSALVDLVRFAASRCELLHFRQAGDTAFWSQLSKAASGDRQVRAAARTAAMQRLLTGAATGRFDRMRTAACAMPRPRARVSEGTDVSNPGARGYNTPLHESPFDKKPDQDLRKR